MEEMAHGRRDPLGEWHPEHPDGWSPVLWNAVYLAVAGGVWLWATPSREAMATWSPGWVAAVALRDVILLVGWYSLAHLRLFWSRSQGTRCKYNLRWPAVSAERFAFGSQLRDNLAWTLASGLPVWVAWEVVTLHLFASGRIPWLVWADNPVGFVALLAVTPLWREVHVYAVHRLLHWGPMFRAVHRIHHRNTNPVPWSGLAMHPVEHLLYFSAVALHWIVPSHPLHALYTSFHLMMAPVPGHAGFHRVALTESVWVPTGGYAHYLHHKLLDVNYGDGVLPLDRWFGSLHDGTPQADDTLHRRRAARPA
ncbi:MAG: sterol desaturase family protein [Acidimicrobiales bacterium]